MKLSEVEFKFANNSLKNINDTSWSVGYVTKIANKNATQRVDYNSSVTTSTESSISHQEWLRSIPVLDCLFEVSLSNDDENNLQPVWVPADSIRFPTVRAALRAVPTDSPKNNIDSNINARNNNRFSRELAGFKPRVGCLVEALWLTDVERFPHWDVGEVKKIEHEKFCYVYFKNRNSQTQIFDNSLLRPVSNVPTFDIWFSSDHSEQKVYCENKNDFNKIPTAIFAEVNFLVPRNLSAVVIDSDPDFFQTAVYSMNSILSVNVTGLKDNNNILIESVNTNNNFNNKNKVNDYENEFCSIKVIGLVQDAKDICTALSARVKAASDNISFQDRRNRRLRLLEGRRSRNEESSELSEFVVHESLIGSVIGKQGDHLSKVARHWKVEIRVLPDQNGFRRVRVYGTDYEKVFRARQDLEHVFYEIALPPDCRHFIDWIRGPGQIGIKEACTRLNIHSLWIDSESLSLVICGLPRTVEDLCGVIHILYESFCHSDNQNINHQHRSYHKNQNNNNGHNTHMLSNRSLK